MFITSKDFNVAEFIKDFKGAKARIVSRKYGKVVFDFSTWADMHTGGDVVTYELTEEQHQEVKKQLKLDYQLENKLLVL